MNFIQLSTDTASTSRTALPRWPDLPVPPAPGGLTTSALTALVAQAGERVGAASSAAHTRCEEIATFTQRCLAVDAETASTLERAGRTGRC